MQAFEFLGIGDDFDERSKFANDVCHLILLSTDGDIDEALENVVPHYYNHYYDNVRNFYEVIDNEVPLFALYDLRRHGASNWGFTEEEYAEAGANCLAAIKELLLV